MKLLKFILLITVILGLTAGCFVSASTMAVSSSDSVNLTAEYDIISFNIRTDIDGGNKAWSYRGQFVIDYLRELDADVVALQEVKRSQFESIRAGLSDKYQMIYYERDTASDPEGLAILFSYEFDLVADEVFWLSETPNQMGPGWDAQYNRICVHAVIRSCYGVTLDVFNTHLEWAGETARNEGLRLIVNKAAKSKYPVVICGDFNADEDEDTYGIISNKFYDTAKLATVTESGWTAHDWGAFDPEWSKPIDFIFTNSRLHAQKFDILDDVISDGIYYSDHFAVKATVTCEYILKYVD